MSNFHGSLFHGSNSRSGRGSKKYIINPPPTPCLDFSGIAQCVCKTQIVPIDNSQLDIISQKHFYSLFFSCFQPKNSIRLKTGDWRPNAEQLNQVPMGFTFSVISFFPIKTSSEILVLILLYHDACTILLSDLNWKIKRKDLGRMQCGVKLNLYFFYKNIVYQYFFAYIDIA